MSERSFNFSPGPAVLPSEVLGQIQHATFAWQQSGTGIFEVSHKSKEFLALRAKLIAQARAVLFIPDDFEVLCLQGGARTQFAMVPLHLLRSQAAYATTGLWSSLAAAEAKHCGKVHQCKVTQNFSWPEGMDYGYYTLNETVQGCYFPHLGKHAHYPLVVDATSSLGLMPLDWSQHDLVFASAQKNLGVAGVTWVMIRKNLCDKFSAKVPAMFCYDTHIQADSLYYTPCTFAWYASYLMLTWMKAQGGVHALSKRVQRWASRIYEYLDESHCFKAHVSGVHRSPINIVFGTGCQQKDLAYVNFAKKQGVLGVQGHASIGGLRVSCYAGQSEEAIEALLSTFIQFEKLHG